MMAEAAEHASSAAERAVPGEWAGPYDAALARLGAVERRAVEQATVGFDGFHGHAFEAKLERKRRYGEVFTLDAAPGGYLFRLELPRRVPPSATKEQFGIPDTMPPYECQVSLRDGYLVVAGHVVDAAVRRLAAVSPAFPPDFTTRVRVPDGVTAFKHRIHDCTLEVVLLKD